MGQNEARISDLKECGCLRFHSGVVGASQRLTIRYWKFVIANDQTYLEPSILECIHGGDPELLQERLPFAATRRSMWALRDPCFRQLESWSISLQHWSPYSERHE
jgi:hypothetical protein